MHKTVSKLQSKRKTGKVRNMLLSHKSATGMDRKKWTQHNSQILDDLYKIFKLQKVSYIRTRDLIAYLCANPSRPWASYFRGSNITARHLSALLKPYGISSCSLYYKEGNAKGYKLSVITQAFRRIKS